MMLRSLRAIRPRTELVRPHAFLPHRASIRRVDVRGESRDKLFVSGEMMPGERVANKGAFKLEDNLFVSIQARSTDQ